MYKTTRMMLLRRQKEEPDARVFKWEKYQFIAKTACPLRLYQALLPISKLPQRRLQQQKVAATTTTGYYYYACQAFKGPSKGQPFSKV